MTSTFNPLPEEKLQAVVDTTASLSMKKREKGGRFNEALFREEKKIWTDLLDTHRINLLGDPGTEQGKKWKFKLQDPVGVTSNRVVHTMKEVSHAGHTHARMLLVCRCA